MPDLTTSSKRLFLAQELSVQLVIISDHLWCDMSSLSTTHSLSVVVAARDAYAMHMAASITCELHLIRKPTQLIDGVDADLFIVGSAYSNDQAWVEGAFCTAESVLVKFLDLHPLISQDQYPFICRC